MGRRGLFLGILLVQLVDSASAAAAVIVPVSISRTVNASSGVEDSASGAQDLDPGQPITSTDPSLTFSINASSSSSLLGFSAQSSAVSGAVTFSNSGSGQFGVGLQLGAQASAGGSASCSTCSASAYASALLSLTFDLTAPIHVNTFAAVGGFGGFGGMGMTLYANEQAIAYGGVLGSLPFDLSPGRYTLDGYASAGASVAAFQLTPMSYGSLFGTFRYSVIPEPGTGLLLFTGLLGFAGWRRRGAYAPMNIRN